MKKPHPRQITRLHKTLARHPVLRSKPLEQIASMLRVREEGWCSWALTLSTEGCRYPEMAFFSIVVWLRDCRPGLSCVGRVGCEFLLEMANYAVCHELGVVNQDFVVGIIRDEV